MDYVYDIKQFAWDSATNSFFADAFHLCATLPDGLIHPEAFPSAKQQFVIMNYETGGFRRFRFVDAYVEYYPIDGFDETYESHIWLFESEDGIKCNITIS